MLNLPDPKVFWNDPAKNPESESPGVKDPEKAKRSSFALRLVQNLLSPLSDDGMAPHDEYDSPEELPGEAEEDVGSERTAERPEQPEETEEESSFTGLMNVIRRNTLKEAHGDEPAPSPKVIEPVRASALAARRHLSHPPRNVNVATHLSPSYAQVIGKVDDAIFPGPQPLPSAIGTARTPRSANLRQKIEDRGYEEDLMRMIDNHAEEKVKRDRKLYTLRQKTPLTSIVFGLEQFEYESPIAALRVRMLLMPAIILLSNPSALKANDVESAIRYARSAQDLAKREGVEEALEARCSYYIGLAAFLLLPKHAMYVSNRPSSIGSLSELGQSETVQSYFEQACAAKGVYDEGTWAEEWVEYLSSPKVRRELSDSVEDERPTSSGSWGVSGWLKRVWGSKDVQQNNGINLPPLPEHQHRRDSAFSQRTDSTSRPSGPERIPSFESWHSGDSRPSSSASSKPSLGDFGTPQLPHEHGSPTTSPTFSSPRSAHKHKFLLDEMLPAPVTSSSPKTSPTRHIKWASISSPVSSDSEVSITSATSPRRHSRRTSLFAMLTGRERRPSEIEQAEEGDSPYRATFEGLDEEPASATSTGRPSFGEGVRKRKGSTEVEDMV